MSGVAKNWIGVIAIAALVLLVWPMPSAAASSPGNGGGASGTAGNQTVISPNGLSQATYDTTYGFTPSTNSSDSSDGPQITATYVYFTCPDGSITVSGSTVCHDQSGVLGYTCTSRTGCSNIATSGSDDSGYFFYGWDDSTWASLAGSGQSLHMYVSTYTGHVETGSITYINGPTLTMTAQTFVNWSGTWSDGMIQVCPNNYFGVCHSRSTSGPYGQQLYEPRGFSYTVLPYNATPVSAGAGLPSGWVVHQWNTTLGSSTYSGYDHATMFFESSGTVSMYAQTAATSNWAGFVYDAPSSSTTVYRVSGTFYVPNASAGGYQSVWAGIGGLTSSLNLWQAGVNVNSTGVVEAWYEWHTSSGSMVYWGTGKITVSSTDEVQAAVSSAGGHSTFWINDTTTQHSWSNAGSALSFTPDSTTGGWIDEANLGSRYVMLFMYCQGMTIGGSTVSLQSGYLVPFESRSASISQLYSTGAFSENNGY